MVDLLPRSVVVCPGCERYITQLDSYYYRGEVATCPKCNARILASSKFGILTFTLDPPSTIDLWRIAYILEVFAVRVDKHLGYKVVYFDDETLANKYGSAVENMGSVVTHSHDGMYVGRFANLDRVNGSSDLYACIR